MAIKEGNSPDALDKKLRENPVWMKIMVNDNTSKLSGYWIDWFTEENFKKVMQNIKERETRILIFFRFFHYFRHVTIGTIRNSNVTTIETCLTAEDVNTVIMNISLRIPMMPTGIRLVILDGHF